MMMGAGVLRQRSSRLLVRAPLMVMVYLQVKGKKSQDKKDDAWFMGCMIPSLRGELPLLPSL
jgi:hypothetical protein